MKIFKISFLLCLSLFLQPTWSEDLATSNASPLKAVGKLFLPPGLKDGDLVTLRIGNRRIRVEVAITPQSREYGLMQRDYLCDDCGMLFVFEKADKHVFWMKDTPLPLSIAFISADGDIINIEEMKPNTTVSHNSQGDALYALEMNNSWFAKNGIMPTDKVQSLKIAPKSR